ncbi:MAG: putative glycoside hydrolase [Candidatus Baltobacteraceae bacterium]
MPLTLAATPAPRHVSTADYFAGYAGTRLVSAPAAARWLTWAETDIASSPSLRALGVKTLLYTDPNRAMKGQPEFTAQQSTFARDCAGAPIETNRPGQFLMDPNSAALRALWKRHVDRYVAAGRFDAVFEDDANTIAYARGQPCGYDAAAWLQATIAMQRSLGYPIVYNGLANVAGAAVSPSIALNATAIGGMMEQCYSGTAAQPLLSQTRWIAAETTELRMASERKLFFCYGNDTTPADRALERRLYVDASFLLSYDPSYSILWEYYEGRSRFHVMPEAQLVPLRPAAALRSVDALRSPTGVYQRTYAACYVAGVDRGRCTIAVNPTLQPLSLALPEYTRTLTLAGGGILDGGSVRIGTARPPAQLAPLGAVIAFR